MSAPLNVRRIITGHEGARAVFTDDQPVEPVTLARRIGAAHRHLPTRR